MRERVRQMETANLAQDAEAVESDPLEPPAVGRLSEIQAPTLVLIGAHDVPDMLTIADLLEREVAGARKVVFAGAAHLPNMEQPEEFNRVVLDFLDSL
jgi:pimeloyl-ACP methyl ester carboxylesterase